MLHHTIFAVCLHIEKIDKDLCECWHFSIFHKPLSVSFIWRSLHFLVRATQFYSNIITYQCKDDRTDEPEEHPSMAKQIVIFGMYMKTLIWRNYFQNTLSDGEGQWDERSGKQNVSDAAAAVKVPCNTSSLYIVRWTSRTSWMLLRLTRCPVTHHHYTLWDERDGKVPCNTSSLYIVRWTTWQGAL